MLGKQAKIIPEKVHSQILDYCARTRYPVRNKVMYLLTIKAGLRSKEVALLRWRMVLNASQQMGDAIHLEYTASKGKKSGRIIPLNNELKTALEDLFQQLPHDPDDYILYSDRGSRLTPQSVTNWFQRTYKALRLTGCSSHSGRRTFITNAARKAVTVGCSLRDVQQLAGHSSLSTTQGYIEGDTEGKRKLVQLI